MAIGLRQARSGSAAVYEDTPLFSSEANPACGPSIRQGIGPMFALRNKWLGDQWSIGDWAGMQRAMPNELPEAVLQAVGAMTPAGADRTVTGAPQNLREYDPEWGRAFVSGIATAACDHENMLGHVKVPVLFTHHLHQTDEATGALMGAVADVQVNRARQLIEAAGNTFTYRSFPTMPHSMHGHDPHRFVDTIAQWYAEIAAP